MPDGVTTHEMDGPLKCNGDAEYSTYVHLDQYTVEKEMEGGIVSDIVVCDLVFTNCTSVHSVVGLTRADLHRMADWINEICGDLED